MLVRILDKALDDSKLSEKEISYLFKVPLFSQESARIIVAARLKSERASNHFAEVHGQIGLNIAPCPKNCAFCAFAAKNKVFKDKSELSAEEAVTAARQFERDGANALFVMATANYPLSKFIEMSQEIRRNLHAETVMVANVGDFNESEARKIKDSGYSGIYHAVRLGEACDTTLPVEQRLQTFEFARQAGLKLGTCLEPVGNEHTVDELVEKTVITCDARACYSGSARRIPIPETELAVHGIVSEARMAHILAVVRLAVGYETPGNCTHEPNVIGAAAGANLLWAESGSNPRDTEEKTEEKRGMTVADCHKILKEAEWQILDGPSRLYRP